MKKSPIVLAVDGSPASEAAVGVGLELASALGSVVHFVHADAQLASAVYEQSADRLTGPEHAEVLGVDGILASAAERAEQAGVECRVRLISETGDIRVQSRNADLAAVIAGIASGLQAGLIIVGSRGRGVIKSAVLGSVSHNLIKFATAPVLIVSSPEDER